MPEEGIALSKIQHSDLLTYEDMLRLAKIFVSLGICHFKVTGGEPLVRKGSLDFMKQLRALPGVKAVTLTTNGILLKKYADELMDAGIDGINVSLDTLDAKRFEIITRRSGLEEVLSGIQYLAEKGYQNLKINVVPMKGFNEDDLVPLARLAQRWPIHVRYIEMMPIGIGSSWVGILPEEVKGRLEKAFGPTLPYEGKLGFGPAEYVSFQGFKGKIGFISAVHNRFCDECNRVRMTAKGYLKLCLQYDKGLNLKALLNEEDEVIRQAIETSIKQKPSGHCFHQEGIIPHREMNGMSDIGG